MPAGSGPITNVATGVVMAADTNEHVVCTISPQNWQSQLGNLLTMSILLTGAATGTVTFRIRQGIAITGAQVGSSVPIATSSGAVATPGVEFPDTSAFGLAQQGGQYVLTYQQSAVSLGTLTSALLELETQAPLI